MSVFLFFGCGGSDEDVPQYKAGDIVIIVKNINKNFAPLLKNYLKERFEKQSELPLVLKFKDYESESCISFGFKFKDIETKENFIKTNFTKDDNTKCAIQDYSIGDATLKGNSGLVIFARRS